MTSSPSPISSALLPTRLLLSTIALATSVGGYLADWNETHVFNPRWTPHAKFHNGQTMSTGLGLGLLTLYFTWRDKHAQTASGALDNLMIATLLGSFYWATQVSAIFYPGTEWVDEEFRESHGTPQRKGAPVIFSACWAAFGVGVWRVGRLGLGVSKKL